MCELSLSFTGFSWNDCHIILLLDFLLLYANINAFLKESKRHI